MYPKRDRRGRKREMNINNKYKFRTSLLILACGLLILLAGYIGGRSYVRSLRNDLMDQAISYVLNMTEQQQQMFDVFVSGDRERLHSQADYLSRTDSDDVEQIREILEVFSKVDAFYSVINLDTGVFYSNKAEETYRMDESTLSEYRTFSGTGVRDPFTGLYSDERRFGYYECFTFADGASGMLQKSYDSSKVSEEFSLSFYNGQGLGYVVTQEGEVLLRSVDKGGAYSFDNIFEMIASSESGNAEIDAFTQATGHRKKGATTFNGENGSYVYAYVPIHNVEGWYLLSVIPVSAVMREADGIILNSQFFLRVLLAAIAVLLAFFLLIRQNRRGIRKKDEEIQYREQQLDIFSTYLASSTDDVYMMLSPTGVVEYISPNVERVLGITEQDIRADVRSLGHVSYTDREAVGFQELEKMEPGSAMEAMMTERVNVKTGEHKCFREMVYCALLQGQKKFIVYISDRTREQEDRDKLAEALDMAQAANKAKSAFLGSVSHDIRTPMNVITGLATLLREEADNPEHVLEYTQQIDVASKHLLGLINDVLDINKIEGGGTVLNISELSLPDIIEEINNMIRPRAKAKNQAFQVAVSSFSHERLLGDKLRINQILINLLSNAVKYTGEGGEIQMSVNELPQAMEDHSRIQFIIRDNGRGMSEEYLQEIFEPFSREQNEETYKIQGTGLGMAITKSLVDLMGGSIRVESQVGKGSTFTLELELRIQEKEEEPTFRQIKEKETDQAAGETEESIVKGMHILVVDDVPINRMILVKILGKLGAVCDTAENGQEAAEKFNSSPSGEGEYGLILMDVQMPLMNGYEATRAIRTGGHPRAEDVAIIAMTANAFVDDVRDALASGMDAHVSKPIVLEQLQAAIRDVLERKKRIVPN